MNKTYIVLFFCTFYNYPFVYRIDIWKKWQPKKYEFKYVFGVSDCHYGHEEVVLSQINAIKNALSKCNRTNTMILVEDMSWYRGFNEGVYKIINESNKTSLRILTVIKPIADHVQIPVLNVEWRQMKALLSDYVRSLYLAEKNNNYDQYRQLLSDLEKEAKESGFTFANLMKETKTILNEIEQYNDGIILEIVYENFIQSMQKSCDKLTQEYEMWLDSKTSEPSSLVNFLRHRNWQSKYLFDFTNTACLLVDARSIHYIQNAIHDRIILFMGGGHISKIGPILEMVGYEHTHAVGQQCDGLFSLESFDFNDLNTLIDFEEKPSIDPLDTKYFMALAVNPPPENLYLEWLQNFFIKIGDWWAWVKGCFYKI